MVVGPPQWVFCFRSCGSVLLCAQSHLQPMGPLQSDVHNPRYFR